MELYRDKYEISNDSKQIKLIWIEPWALEIEVLPNSNCILYSDSKIKGKFEIEIEKNRIIVYGWAGTGLIVEVDGKKEWNYSDVRIPIMSNGMSTKEFVDFVFKSSHKKWWEFWK